MEKEFIRVRSAKDIIIFVSFIIAGSVLILLPTGTSVNITGFFMIFTGLILAFVLKTGYKDMETGESYRKEEHFFKQTMNPAISAVLASRPQSIDLSQEDKGNGVRLDVYYSKSSGRAYLQLFEYVPYKYEPCSAVYEHRITDVNKLIR